MNKKTKTKAWDLSFRGDIDKYLRKQGISKEQFCFVSMYKWENIYDNVLLNFVDGIRNKNKNLHWLNVEGGLSKDVELCYGFCAYKQYDWIFKLSNIVNEKKAYLLIEECDKFWIADGDVNTISQVIWEDDFYGADYYIVDKKYNWMITSDHHEGVTFIAKKTLDGKCFNSVLYEIPRYAYYTGGRKERPLSIM